MTEPSNPASATPPPPSPGIRWWPGVLILLGFVGYSLYVLGTEAALRQSKVMRLGVAVLISLVLTLLWIVFAARLSRRGRWRGLGVFVLALIVLKFGFRYEGVTGDLVPILTPRWVPRTRAPLAVDVAAGPAAATNAPRTVASTTAGPRADFPQFLGPTRDGVVTGVVLQLDWRAQPPQLLWKQAVGAGWGGFAVVGSRAITQEQQGPDEWVICYDAETGRRLWAHHDPARYDNPIGGLGPRATPTVDGSRVFTFGSTGQLNCFDLESGRRLWGTNVVGAVDPQALEWGASSSPLRVGEWVIVAPRGLGGVSLVALRASDGSAGWSGGTDDPHYSSPRLETLLGVPQLLTFTAAGVAASRPDTGEVMWDYGWRGGHPHVSDPRVVSSNRVLIASGYGTGAQLIEVTAGTGNRRWQATNTVWRSMRLKSKFANLLLKDGFVYGLDDGKLVCLDLADGHQRWQGERYGHGQLLLVGEVILLTAESGDVVLVEASPQAFRELTRFSAVEGKTWNPPALAGNLLLVRNDREAAAYRLPTKP